MNISELFEDKKVVEIANRYKILIVLNDPPGVSVVQGFNEVSEAINFLNKMDSDFPDELKGDYSLADKYLELKRQHNELLESVLRLVKKVRSNRKNNM